MTTRIKTLAEMLVEKRDGGDKAPIYRMLGVPPGTYDTWEGGVYLPKLPKHIEALAVYLNRDEDELALQIYHERKQTMGGYVDTLMVLAQPLVAA